MALTFDNYPGLQPEITPAQKYATQCKRQLGYGISSMVGPLEQDLLP